MESSLDNNPSDESIASIYPDIIPAEIGHPTSAKFLVEDTGDERGKGIKAKVKFHEDECVAKLSGVIVNRTTLDTIQITPTLYFADQWFCRFLLHSCDPNLEIDVERLDLRALKNISIGEFLTVDYANTDDAVTSQFACNCLAEKCRRWITGRTEEVNDEGRSFIAQQNL